MNILLNKVMKSMWYTILVFAFVFNIPSIASKIEKPADWHDNINYNYLVISDPQAWRNPQGADPNNASGEQIWLSNMVKILTTLRRVHTENNAVMTIINGDLTEFGWGEQLVDYKEAFDKSYLRIVFPGLGNHDYANNVDDCADNACAVRMISYMEDWLSTYKNKYHTIDDYDYTCWDSEYYRDCHGSMAYSWVAGEIKYIQLNNYPTYNFSMRTSASSYKINSGLNFLKREILNAREEKKAVVINFHDGFDHFISQTSAQDRDIFRSLVTQPEVIAVFVAHTHAPGERTGSNTGFYGSTRVYDSGAIYQGDFFKVKVSGKCITPELNKINLSTGELTVVHRYHTSCVM